MSVLGIGIDVAKTSDFVWAIENPDSFRKLLNKSEILMLPTERSELLTYITSLFACKEAIIKASQSLTLWDLPSLIVVKEKNNAPRLEFNFSQDPRIIREAEKKWILSLSHESKFCIAVAIAQN